MNTGQYTYERRGAAEVPIVGKADKVITSTFTVTASGEFLPMQLIYTGETFIIIINVHALFMFIVSCTDSIISS